MLKKEKTLKLRRLNVKGPIEKIPESITIEIGTMNIGDAVRVSDMNIDGLTP